MIDKAELGALFEGLRASVTIADQDFQITFMNDRSCAYFAEDGGAELVGKNLLDCHNAEQTAVIRDAYARYDGCHVCARRSLGKGEEMT